MTTLWQYVREGKLPASVHHSEVMVSKVLSALRESGTPLSYSEIAERTGYSVNSFRPRLHQLNKYTGAVKKLQGPRPEAKEKICFISSNNDRNREAH